MLYEVITKLDISFGPDIIITLLTIPLGILTIAGISFLVTRLLVITSYSIHYTKLYEFKKRCRYLVAIRIIFNHLLVLHDGLLVPFFPVVNLPDPKLGIVRIFRFRIFAKNSLV